ncbi:MAG: DUF6089 family protein, partial [Bacteroidota bacterium]
MAFLCLCCLGGTMLQAQNQKWEVGVGAGLSLFQGDLVDSRMGDLSQGNLTGGFLVRYHLNQNIALRGNILLGALEGDDRVGNDDRPDLVSRGFSFNSTFYETSLMLEFDILGGLRNFNPDKGHNPDKYKNGFRRLVSPYLFAGIGAKFLDLETEYGTRLNTPDVVTDRREQIAYGNSGLVVPFGGGIKVDLSRNIALGAEVGWRAGFTDYWDGVSQSGEPDNDDWFVTGLVNLSVRLGETDTDKDGVVDSEDNCPTVPGEMTLKGCPDGDKDGIADKDDKCPTVAGLASLAGCPDADGDGVTDAEDLCPQTAGLAAFSGCPDTDGDGIVDKDDACPEVAGIEAMAGCPDTDGDGIADQEDNCPTEAGTAANRGCPILDRDGDGVADDVDECPDAAGTLRGCPDADNDGVADKFDKCPTTAGSLTNNGCPELKKADRDILDFAVKNIRFNSAKATFRQESFAIMDQVADVLQRYPDYRAAIGGHTDSIGSSATNQKLSERRAKACYDYLISKGISPARLSYTGYGEKNPIADNINEAGRKQNRRV